MIALVFAAFQNAILNACCWPHCLGHGYQQYQSISELEPFFKFQNKDILTVCDAPHVMKYTQILFCRCNMYMDCEPLVTQLPVMASGDIFWIAMNLTRDMKYTFRIN
jgi:hypothetical protein